jgi:hypothetical protein
VFDGTGILNLGINILLRHGHGATAGGRVDGRQIVWSRLEWVNKVKDKVIMGGLGWGEYLG